ncbi:transmembrane protein 260 isoform X1 [Polypterus senegalus]|uniref:transmembrane protein 260 isoform X1 n=1 Tax=Polypterus senegalus TaxID=55291 RepID=UPI0019654C04|nr:transmembrane protein 260 isoform X1 [Polypterus senegalus]
MGKPKDSCEAWQLTLACFAGVSALYLRCTQRSVPGGDSGELITAACELGVAHPPGYPLFTLLAYLASKLTFLNSPAYCVNLLNSLLGAMSSAALCFATYRLTNFAPSGILVAGCFAMSHLVWQWSMVAEVFSLNNLFIGLLFSLTACFHTANSQEQRAKFSRLGAFCCGLALCNQHTIVIYVIVICPWVLIRLLMMKELSFGLMVELGLCFLAGLFPYIYLAVSSFMNRARWSWGDQTSFPGFMTHLLRSEYGTFSLAKTDTEGQMMKIILAQWNHCVKDLSLPVLTLAATGLVMTFFRRKYSYYLVSWILASMFIVYSMFFAWRANLDISRPLFLAVVERFWVQSDAVLCVLSGLGLASVCKELEKLFGNFRIWKSVAWIFTLGFIVHHAHLNFRFCDQSDNFIVDSFARNILASIPNGSIILTRGDLPGNSMRYLHYCEGLRPDLALVDQELMTYNWYVPKLGPHLSDVHFPGSRWNLVSTEQKRTFNLHNFFSSNIQRGIFICIGLPDEDQTWRKDFMQVPWGVCDRIIPSTAQFDPGKWAQLTRHLYNWTTPHNSTFPPGSWEEVVNTEMWQSRIKMPFFLFDLAEKQNKQGKSLEQLYELSYMLYHEIVSKFKNHPVNWHKNLALACERLLRTGSKTHDPENLLSESIHHFRLYLKGEPEDPQRSAIIEAIHHLKKERERLHELKKDRESI